MINAREREFGLKKFYRKCKKTIKDREFWKMRLNHEGGYVVISIENRFMMLG